MEIVCSKHYLTKEEFREILLSLEVGQIKQIQTENEEDILSSLVFRFDNLYGEEYYVCVNAWTADGVTIIQPRLGDCMDNAIDDFYDTMKEYGMKLFLDVVYV